MVALSVSCCREANDAAGLRKQLQVVFANAPDCVEAKLLEAELLLQDKDHGGKQQA